MRHAGKIVGTTLLGALGLGVLAGAEPGGPKPGLLTVESREDGQIQIRLVGQDRKPLDLKVERLADGRFRVERGDQIRFDCRRFRIASDGLYEFSGAVLMKRKDTVMRADRVAYRPETGDVVVLDPSNSSD